MTHVTHSIDNVPRDGTLVYVSRSDKPEWGEHLMSWSERRKRWEGMIFAPMGSRRTWWDLNLHQPDRWRAS